MDRTGNIPWHSFSNLLHVSKKDVKSGSTIGIMIYTVRCLNYLGISLINSQDAGLCNDADNTNQADDNHAMTEIAGYEGFLHRPKKTQ
jgi:hypothetical protein